MKFTIAASTILAQTLPARILSDESVSSNRWTHHQEEDASTPTSTAGDVSQFLATLQKEQQLTTTATGLRKRLSGLLQDRRRESRKLLTNDASTALGPSTKAFVSNQKLAHAYVPDEYPVLPVVARRHEAGNENPYVNSINNNNIIQCQQSLHAHKPGF